jgi:Tol biopolymer transport system component
MQTSGRPLFCVAALCLCGCPYGKPSDHYRPHGHQDTTIAISPKDDAILFNAAGTGGRDLYLLHLPDLTVTQVADSPDYEVCPSFSPDGKRIVYAAGIPGDRADHIFTIGRDGNGKTQLTTADANDTSPKFSPDGSMIVFARDKTYQWGGLAANWEPGGVICVIGSDGSGERELTPHDFFAFAPSFSHDGQEVLFLSMDGLYSMPVDGSQPPKKTGPFLNSASYSPDGTQVVFSDGKYSPDYELFISGRDGTNRVQITSSNHGCFHPVFTSSGDRVYFLMEEWPQGQTGVPTSSIWTVKSDGSKQQQVTDSSLFDAPQAWKPSRLP